MVEEPQSLGSNPDLPLPALVTLGKMYDLSVPRLPPLESGKGNSASLLGLLGDK